MSVAGCLARGGWHGCHEQASGHETVLVALLIVALLAACVAIALALERERRRARSVPSERRAMHAMSELCPHGWEAHITLYGGGAPTPADAPRGRRQLVELEWKQLDQAPGGVAVARRVWASTIDEALHAMVDDRRTDITFEEIERAAVESGDVHWND